MEKLDKLKNNIEISKEEIKAAFNNLPGSNLEFGNSVIFNEFYLEDQTVVTLKNDKKIAALSWNSKKVAVTEIILNDYNSGLTVDDFKEMIIQMLLLFDADNRNFSGKNIEQYLLTGEELPDDVVEHLEDMFANGVYKFSKPTMQDFFLKKDIMLLFEDILKPVEEVEEIIEEETTIEVEVEVTSKEDVTDNQKDAEEKNLDGEIYFFLEKVEQEIANENNSMVSVTNDSKKTTVPKNIERQKVVEPESTTPKTIMQPLVATSSEQISFDELLQEAYIGNKFEEMLQEYLLDALDNKLLDYEAKIKKAKANVMASKYSFLLKAVEKAAKKQKLESSSSYTEFELRKLKPFVFDDAKAKEYFIKVLKLDFDLVQLAMEYRKLNRERLLKDDMDAIVTIHSKPAFTGSEEAVSIAIAAMITGENLLLSGVASAGKSTMVETLSALLNLPLARISGNADTTIDSLVGHKRIKDGEIVVMDAPLIHAIKKGYLFFFDELSSVDAQVASLLNPVLDDQKSFTNELSGEVIKVHPEARFIAAINDASLGYAGTTELNTATKSRFIVAKVEYVSEETLEIILSNTKPAKTKFQEDIVGLNNHTKGDIHLVIQIAEKLKEAYEAGEVSEEALAIRGYKSFLNLAKVLPVDKAINAIINKMEEDELPAVLGALESIRVLRITPEKMLGA